MVFEVKYRDEELIQILVNLGVKLGRTPKMSDLRKKDGGPYPSLYQRRFSSDGIKQDGWNIALERAGYDPNRKKVDQENECLDCGVNGFTAKGNLIRWKGTETTLCMSCYQKRYYRENRRGN